MVYNQRKIIFSKHQELQNLLWISKRLLKIKKSRPNFKQLVEYQIILIKKVIHNLILVHQVLIFNQPLFMNFHQQRILQNQKILVLSKGLLNHLHIVNWLFLNYVLVPLEFNDMHFLHFNKYYQIIITIILISVIRDLY